jgi:hypothetical protein
MLGRVLPLQSHEAAPQFRAAKKGGTTWRRPHVLSRGALLIWELSVDSSVGRLTMLDINLLREKPEFVKAAMRDLNVEAPIDEILALDAHRRELLTEVEALRAERNAVSKEIGRTKD